MYGFDRLIRQMDEIAERLSEDIVMQIGNGSYEPNNAKYFRYMPIEEIESFYKTSRLVICHAGVGSILSILNHHNNMIVVPRLKRYDEAVDDHQLQIAAELKKEGIAEVVYNIADLERTIINFDKNCKIFKQKNGLTTRLKEYLDKLEKDIPSRNHKRR